MSGEGVAQDQLVSFFERWQRLEEDKTAISDDLKELFAEAKGFGFDTKVMRKVFRDNTADAGDRAEFEAVYELYASALGMSAAPRENLPRDPRVRTRENIEQFGADDADEMHRTVDGSPETGSEVSGKPPQDDPGQPEGGQVRHVGAGESPATSIHGEPLPGSSGEKDMMAEDQRAGAPEAQEGQTEPADGNQSAPALGSIAEGVGPASGSDVETVAQPFRPDPEGTFRSAKGLLRRVGCLNPECCAGGWRALCTGCSVGLNAVHQDSGTVAA